MYFHPLLYLVALLGVIPAIALSIPEEESIITIPLPNEEMASLPSVATAEVGWQSIFWGLFFVALNAMTVPSILDTFLHIQGSENLLYLMRSSPFICMADALDVLICLFLVVVVRGGSISDAACVIDSWYSPQPVTQDGHDLNATTTTTVRTLEQIPTPAVAPNHAGLTKKHPVSSLVIFLATSTQAVKIFAFQGPSLWWVKASCGIYLFSYLVLICTSSLPRNPNFNTTKPQHNQLTTHYISLLLHPTCASYAIWQLIHHAPMPETVIVMILISGMTMVGLAFLLFSLLESKPWPFLAAVGFMFVWFISAPFSTWSAWSLELALQGAGVGLLTLLGSSLVYAATGWISRRLPFLGRFIASELSVEHFSGFYFAAMNLVITSLYCRYVYDPTGTVKPAWTEILG